MTKVLQNMEIKSGIVDTNNRRTRIPEMTKRRRSVMVTSRHTDGGSPNKLSY